MCLWDTPPLLCNDHVCLRLLKRRSRCMLHPQPHLAEVRTLKHGHLTWDCARSDLGEFPEIRFHIPSFGSGFLFPPDVIFFRPLNSASSQVILNDMSGASGWVCSQLKQQRKVSDGDIEFWVETDRKHKRNRLGIKPHMASAGTYQVLTSVVEMRPNGANLSCPKIVSEEN